MGPVVRPERPIPPLWPSRPLEGRHRGEPDQLDRGLVVGQRVCPTRGPPRRPRAIRRGPCRTRRRDGWCPEPAASRRHPPEMHGSRRARRRRRASTTRPWRTVPTGSTEPTEDGRTTGDPNQRHDHKKILPTRSFLEAATTAVSFMHFYGVGGLVGGRRRRASCRATVAAEPIPRRMTRASSSSAGEGADRAAGSAFAERETWRLRAPPGPRPLARWSTERRIHNGDAAR